MLEELRIEAAKGQLSRLVISKDYRFILEDYHREVELQPVHKAVYLLFHIVGSSRIWYERLKVITLPRNLVVMESEM